MTDIVNASTCSREDNILEYNHNSDLHKTDFIHKVVQLGIAFVSILRVFQN